MHLIAARSWFKRSLFLALTLAQVSVGPAEAENSIIDAIAAGTPLIDLKPDHIAKNISMAIALVASTRGVSLLPLYAQNLLPKTVVSRPIRGNPPMIDLVVGYNEANTSPLLKFLLSKVDELKFRVSGRER